MQVVKLGVRSATGTSSHKLLGTSVEACPGSLNGSSSAGRDMMSRFDAQALWCDPTVTDVPARTLMLKERRLMAGRPSTGPSLRTNSFRGTALPRYRIDGEGRVASRAMREPWRLHVAGLSMGGGRGGSRGEKVMSRSSSPSR